MQELKIRDKNRTVNKRNDFYDWRNINITENMKKESLILDIFIILNNI